MKRNFQNIQYFQKFSSYSENTPIQTGSFSNKQSKFFSWKSSKENSKFFPSISSSTLPLSLKGTFHENFQPENSEIFFNLAFDKGRLKTFVLWFLKTYGQKKTVELLEQLKEFGFGYATKAGVSLGIDDLKIPPQKQNLLRAAQEKVSFSDIQYKKAQITGIERLQKFIDTWHETSENLKQEVVKYFEKTDILNPVYMMAFSGARGNLSQVRQLVGMRGLMADPQGQIIDFPIRSNFREGLTLTEYIISTYGARKGIVDTALRTANAGYLTRRLVDVAQHVIVTEFDCRTEKGIFVFEMKEANKTICTFQNRLIGRTLAKEVRISNDFVIPRNHEISEEQAEILAKVTKKALIRSPLTCQTKKFVCQLCYGWSLATNRLVSIGEAVGVIAAQSIGEPGTQLTMRTFHTGGVFSGGILEQITAMDDGIVEYPTAIAGLCVRTPQGDIAFLTKGEGSLVLRTKKTSTPEKEMKNEEIVQVYKIPPYTLLFQRNQQKVEKKQIIAQLSSLALQKRQRGDAEQVIYSPHEGEIYHSQMDIIEKPTEYDDITFETWNSGYFWILSGKIYEFPVSSYLFVQPSDFVNQNSVFNRISWVTPRSSFLNVCLKKSQKTKFSFFKFHSFLTKRNQQILLDFYSILHSPSHLRKKLLKQPNPFLTSSGIRKRTKKTKSTSLPIIQSRRILNLKFQHNFLTSVSFFQNRKRGSFRLKSSDSFQQKLSGSFFFLKGSPFSKKNLSQRKFNNIQLKFQKLKKSNFAPNLLTSFHFIRRQSSSFFPKKDNKLRAYTRIYSKKGQHLLTPRLNFYTDGSIPNRRNWRFNSSSSTIQNQIHTYKQKFYQKSNAKFLFYLQQKKENVSLKTSSGLFSNQKSFFSSLSLADRNKKKPSYFLLKTPLISLKLENIRFQNIHYSFDCNVSANQSLKSENSNFDQMFSYLSLKNSFATFRDSVFLSSKPQNHANKDLASHSNTFLNTYHWSPLPNLFLKWFPENFRTNSNGILFLPISFKEKEEQQTNPQSFMSFFPYTKTSENQKKVHWKETRIQKIFFSSADQNLLKKSPQSSKNPNSFLYLQEIPVYRMQPNFFAFPAFSIWETENTRFVWTSRDAEESTSLHVKTTKHSGTGKVNSKQKNQRALTKILNFVKPLYITKNAYMEGQKEKKDSDFILSSNLEESNLLPENLEVQPEKAKRKTGLREKTAKFVRLRSRFSHYLTSSLPLKGQKQFEDFSKNRKTEKLSTFFSDLFWVPKENFRISNFENFMDSKTLNSFQPKNYGQDDSQKPLFVLVNRQGIRKPIYSKIHGFTKYSKKALFFHRKNQNKISFSNFPTSFQNSKNPLKLLAAHQKIETQSLSSIQKTFLNFLKARKIQRNHKFTKIQSFAKRKPLIEKKIGKGSLFSHLLIRKPSQFFASSQAKEITTSMQFISKLDQNYEVFSTNRNQKVLDIQVEQGWVYFVQNIQEILPYHQLILQSGKQCCGFTFENQPIYLKCILFENQNMFFEQFLNGLFSYLETAKPNSKLGSGVFKNKKSRFFQKNSSFETENQEKLNSESSVDKLFSLFSQKKDFSSFSFKENQVNFLKQMFDTQKKQNNPKRIALFIQPMEYKPLTSLYSLKRNIYRHQKKEKSLSFFLLRNFHSTILNKQNTDRRLLSFYPSPDFQIQPNFNLPTIDTKIKSTNTSGFWNLQKTPNRNPSSGDFQNPDINSSMFRDLEENLSASPVTSFSSPLVTPGTPVTKATEEKNPLEFTARFHKDFDQQKMERYKKPLEAENQRRKRNYSFILQNRKEPFDSSNLGFYLHSYFSYFPMHFLPLTLSYSVPINFYDSFNFPFLNFTKTQFISLNYKNVSQKSLNALFHLVNKTSFSSLFANIRVGVDKNRPEGFSFTKAERKYTKILQRFENLEIQKEQLEAISLINNSVFSPYFNLDLADKMSYLANQRLYLQETDGFFKNFENFYQENIPSLMHFPVFRNQFVLNPTNFVSKEKPFAFTSFLSPFEGEILPMTKNSWSPLFPFLPNDFDFSPNLPKMEGFEELNKKPDSFMAHSLAGEEVISSRNEEGFETNSHDLSLVFQDKENSRKHTLVLTKANLFALSLKERDILNSEVQFPTVQKNQTLQEILRQQNRYFLEIDRYLNTSSALLSEKKEKLENLPYGGELQNIAKLMQERQEKFESSMNQPNKTILVKYQNKIYKIQNLSLGLTYSYKTLRVGSFLVYGDLITPYSAISKSGQVIHVSSNKITLRYAYPISAPKRSVLHVSNGDFVRRNDAIVTLPFQTLKTGDIVQGIPKVEQYFEARTSKEGRLFRDSLPNLLQGLFERYQTFLTLEKAVQQSYLKIQQIIVDGIQRVYRSQGVSISEKHLEVIVRQMTAKVQIIHAAQTGFFAGELVDLEFVEYINSFLMNKIKYEPIILGITRASLEVDSFLSAASFQQTTKILSKAAIYRKKDFLKGLKENLIVGNLIPGGTGYLVYLNDQISP